MSYKCKICGINEVEHAGEVCELCAIGQDPYVSDVVSKHPPKIPVQPNTDRGTTDTPRTGKSRKVLLNGGAAVQNVDPYGNRIVPTPPAQPPVQVYSAGQAAQLARQGGSAAAPVAGGAAAAPAAGKAPLATGIVKNIQADNAKKSIPVKWLRALFTGVPFTFDNTVMMFQVFPDHSGTALNALGNACDQVIVYGSVTKGAISENNDIEVYGRRDSHNNIVAKSIKNKASGTTITPAQCLGQAAVLLITLSVLLLIAMVLMGLGLQGIALAALLILCILNMKMVMRFFRGVINTILSMLRSIFRSIFR